MELNNTLSSRVYWKKVLGDSPLPTGLIRDYLNKADCKNLNSVTFLIDEDTSDQLRDIGQSKPLSQFAILLSGLQVVFSKYTDSEELLLHVPPLMDDKRRKALPIRSTVKWHESFKEHILRSSDQLINVYTHGLQLEDEEYSKASILVLSEELHDLAIVDDAEISLCFSDNGRQIKGTMYYKEGLFREDLLEMLVKQFSFIMRSLVTDRLLPLSSISFVRPEEEVQIQRFNELSCFYPESDVIANLFEVKALTFSEKVAVVEQGKTCTYETLNKNANRIAHLLRQSGVQRNEFVGVFMERGIDFITSVVGVLKSGAAFVPIDPAYPAQRVSYMIANSKVPTIVTNQRCLNNIELGDGTTALRSALLLDHATEVSEDISKRLKINDRSSLDQMQEVNPSVVNESDDVAYMIYTSGSTGNPKGAMVRHNGAINHIYAEFEALNFSEHTRFLQSAPSSSDISVWQMLAPLLIGGASVVVGTDIVSNPPLLFKVMKEEKISLFEPVPIVLQGLIEHIESLDHKNRKLPDLLFAMVTGEEVKVSVVNRWLDLFPDIPVVNAYGPTEAADDVCQAMIRKPIPSDAVRVPIGKPVANMQIHILDKQLKKLPIGFPGEICVSGIGVGAGYWQNPQKTQEVFLSNPHARGDKEAQLYKTGDLGRFLPDGNIEFLERIDNQVKIRGFRIELGEIEAILSQHQDIAEVYVVDREWKRNKILVAFYRGSKKVEQEIFKTFLKDKLPLHMVPTAYVHMEQMPLLPNGKVNKDKLTFLGNDLQVGNEYVAPSSPIQTQLQGIWQQLLKLDRIGVKDNFFDLGGHSFLVMKMTNEVEKELKVRVSLPHFLAKPTIENLATIVGDEDTYTEPSLSLKESILKDIHIEDNVASWTNFTNVLLTGGTGILGVNILHDLLKHTQAQVFCMVRCRSEEHGRERIINKLKDHQLWEDAFMSRIQIVAGDLEKKFFGLQSHEFEQLAAKLDVIFHNGAQVNFAYPYHTLKKANVDGTKEILKLAALHGLKPIHYISSLSVFENYGYSTIITEDHKLILNDTLLNDLGYTQTKWVADKVMTEARQAGFPVNIYRPETISGHSETGIWNTTDFACKSLRNMAIVSAIPRIPLKFNWVPVDYASRSIVHLAKNPKGLNKNYHIVSPHYLDMGDIIKWIKPMGFDVKKLSFRKWKSRILDLQGKSELLDEVTDEIFKAAKNYDPSKVHKFAQQNTITGLTGTDIYCPPIDKAIVQKYFEYFGESGFLTQDMSIPYSKTKGKSFFSAIFNKS
ncbi:non-ribosomal peptide synthetase [Fulvivirga kasyanovii]|uniref:Amino acid adenylation domain-containing protein n=1 Tax=Fulvivirga kasyanovii TaxID=396812 RepID=A0ABW9RUI8_9BACT|nr:non-ribosomal peptide synthetase [Fulvivirga kasyanovii]MTI27658.1 amino acid adenylation domain-containing protein [Fulvivirga kasyanovii]